MKMYLTELRGQVRGNARLRRRLNSLERRNQVLQSHIACLVTLCDKSGLGDEPEVVHAAIHIGWVRYVAAVREEIKRQIEKTFGVQL